MSAISKRILDVITKKAISYGELSNATGIAKSALQRYATGQTEKIPIDRLEKIADALCVSSAYLMGWEETPVPSESIPYKPTGMVPILGSIPAGCPATAFEDIQGYEPIDLPNPENYYWLRVNGRSMINAGILDGDLALIRMQSYAENGQIVACRVNGDEATLKRFKQKGDTVFLMPENPEFEPYIVPASEFSTGYAAILGVLVETKRKY